MWYCNAIEVKLFRWPQAECILRKYLCQYVLIQIKLRPSVYREVKLQAKAAKHRRSIYNYKHVLQCEFAYQSPSKKSSVCTWMMQYMENTLKQKRMHMSTLPPSGTYPIQMETRLPYLERVCRTQSLCLRPHQQVPKPIGEIEIHWHYCFIHDLQRIVRPDHLSFLQHYPPLKLTEQEAQHRK